MKIGIYISGLGQSVENESVDKYATRLMNEMNFNTNGIKYVLKIEIINYTEDQQSNVVSIYGEKEPDKIVYKIYDFKYHNLLTDKFNSYSIISKNFWLFLLVFRKFPVVFKRLFARESYSRPLQTFYIFLIFLIIALAVLFMIPAAITAITGLSENLKVRDLLYDFKNFIGVGDIPFISKEGMENISKAVVSITAVLIVIIPNANVLLSNLATEFVCANDYIQQGSQKQLILGNLELLVDYISENEKDCKLHFHTYSFGSILALDYIYPFGNKVSKNAEMFCEALVTIGTPFEFIKSYYPLFYKKRKLELGDKLHWLNVYSTIDALATNFRKDAKEGESEFGIEKMSNRPKNINYEVVSMERVGLIDFLLLYTIKVHGMYWDDKTEGQSCLGYIYQEMKIRNLI
ncbi:hypothetical protein [Flavobacterium sp. 245]|uniref:hypothetical protein n=1 Tax=Flavobacterium sp. 245 TaxID=2512115 RepID=UPI00105F16F2|nr:hypothetical protein [Flavobacterium sp. 245]TDO94941.1 hypothetical protein EV145_11527 [Flavobacterium sp. 245]